MLTILVMTQLGLQSIEGAELEKEWKTGATVCSPPSIH